MTYDSQPTPSQSIHPEVHDDATPQPAHDPTGDTAYDPTCDTVGDTANHSHPAIVTVTLNAALDVTYLFAAPFVVGGANRVTEMIKKAGGKGNNVARAVHRMGGQVIATGFIGGQNGERIAHGLREEGIASDFVPVAGGESRLCLALVDSEGQSTEVLEPGVIITEDDVTALQDKLRILVKPGAFVSFSGSLPKGLSIQDFHSLVQTAREAGGRIVIDTSGSALETAVTWGPEFIKPNAEEICTLVPGGASSELTDGLLRLAHVGVGTPLVTLGGDGALAYHAGRFYRARAVPVEVRNTVGSGDSFLGTLLWSLSTGHHLGQALALAIAAGADNATRQSAADIERASVLELAKGVIVEDYEE